VRASLDIIHLSSLDAILLRELWPPSFVRHFFSDFGIQTMDHPRLHYMAGKMFFMGMKIPSAALLGPHSTSYLSEYLMVQRHPDWANFPLESKLFQSFLESTRESGTGYELPMASAIKLKASLNGSKEFSLTQQEKQFFLIELIPMITGKAKGEDAWITSGLRGLRIEERLRRCCLTSTNIEIGSFPIPSTD